jgi:hypothetical protein
MQQQPALQQQAASRDEARMKLPPIDTGNGKSRNRFVPRLSLRRKPLTKEPEPAPMPKLAENPAPPPANSTVAGHGAVPDGDVSPIGQISATLFPTKNGTLQQQQSSPPDNPPAPPAKQSSSPAPPPPPPRSYQYNSDDFQIENPFADRYTTTSGDSNGTSQNGSGQAVPPAAPQGGDLTAVRGEGSIPGFQTYRPAK